MSKGFNSCNFLGNTGRDPEIRATPSGTIVANFSIAVSDREKVGGEWKDVTEWVSCVAFGRTAEIVRDYLKKGHKVFVSGKMKTRSWDQDGQKRYKTEILVNELSLLSGTERSAPQESTPQGSSFDASQPIGDDDIPF